MSGGQTRAYVMWTRLIRPDGVSVALASPAVDAAGQTGLTGKWGLGEPETTGVPNRQGFDVFFGYLNQQHAHNYYPTFLLKGKERLSAPARQFKPKKARVFFFPPQAVKCALPAHFTF